MAWAQKRAQVRAQVRPMVGRRGGSLYGAGTPAGILLGSETSGLALDFANASALSRGSSQFLGAPDDLLTYTAPSPKLVYDVAGVLRYAPHNLMIRSQDIDNVAAWGTSLNGGSISANIATAPDGTTTADKFVENTANSAHEVGQTITVSALTAYTFTCYLKPAGRDWVFLNAVYPSVADHRTWYNITTGVIGTTDPSVTASMQNVGNGWYRCRYTITTVAGQGSIAFKAGTALTDTSSGFTGDGTSGFYAWGFMGELNATPSIYLPTTTAARYGLPYDYDPITHAALGIYVEEQRTNLLLASQAFSAAAPWNTAGSNQTVAASATSAPDGVNTLFKITETSTSSYRGQDITLAAATTYTCSIFAKRFDNDWVYFGVYNGSDRGVWFNLATGAVGSSLGGATGRITALVGGIYRLQVTFTTSTTASAVTFPFCIGPDGSTTRVSGASHLSWGVQLEAGAFATSYIPTVASQVTRAADQISLAKTLFPFDAAKGTVVWQGDSQLDASAHWLWSLDDGTSNQRIQNYLSGNAPLFFVVDGGVTQALISDANISNNTLFKTADAWSANDFAMSMTGRAAVTDALGTVPTVTTLRIGGNQAGAGQINGHIKTLKYLPRRASNSELQAMAA